ncbi:hypothetical protein BOTBODRAFT_113248 [Botryobasidium botryosum FD-172 SS1]|uniref:DAGKc domain-containing protein n=1 Tax=Botryobasidium botryosum (strain FD-172 SS1) TaxID=930990 RepID=A0A067M9L9_BOTB1|nr:hypothetical protein BOTBODRAFT_113248 [Botryobasidium botryosum FD-172 SS1]
MSVLIIQNPVSGEGTAVDLIKNSVIPLLDSHSISHTIQSTTEPGHAGSLALSFLQGRCAEDKESAPKDSPVLILAGGDGTLHEVVNAVGLSAVENSEQIQRVVIVILPCGTANALYSTLFPPSPDGGPYPKLSAKLPAGTDAQTAYKLQSLLSYLDNAGRRRPLVLTHTRVLDKNGDLAPVSGSSILSAVVTSTSLHASILDTAEELRAEVPGVARFSVAAERNIHMWYGSHVQLLPSDSDFDSAPVQRYDPSANKFVELEGMTELEGPYSYFLSTVNVDRLEPTFVITPLAATDPPSPGVMEVILVRPTRDPSFEGDTPEGRKKFVEKIVPVLRGAFQNGAHLGIGYDSEGNIKEDPALQPVAEYYRCAKWIWEPTPGSAGVLVCADGTLVKIPGGGRAICSVVKSFEEGGGFHIWA